jgi:capping protein (actin filament) muscle Z-line, beta
MGDTDYEKKLSSALDLFRRLPPAHLETNLEFVCSLSPDLADDLLQTVDAPLKIANDPSAGKDFIKCDYNRDGDSYRSPWTNQYYPPIDGDDAIVPPDNLRQLEEQANFLFRAYCDQYYEGGLSSVYFWEVDGGFAACVLFKKGSLLSRPFFYFLFL